MSNFTPGPWVIRESMTQIGKCYRVSTEPVIECGHGAAVLYDDNTSLNPHASGVQQANANLIAAAPEMYEALNLALKCIDYCRRAHKDIQSGTGVPVETFLKAALAKADGGQQ